ncbi:MAG: hypothetical protein H7Y18_20630 [Clostridiaceae bacterium]|nr:hypothetical protein [Clostridiaceae bacterium]
MKKTYNISEEAVRLECEIFEVQEILLDELSKEFPNSEISFQLFENATLEAEIIDEIQVNGEGIKVITFSNGRTILNTTPYTMSFDDNGKGVKVPPCGFLLNSTVSEEKVSDIFITTKYIGNQEGFRFLDAVKEINEDIIIVGSIVSAQAYPRRVVAMCAMKGYEKAAPGKKRMNPNLFTIFMK